MIVDDCGTQRLTVNLVGRCWKCLHMFPPVHYWICLEEVGLRQLLQPWLKIQHPPDSASVFVLSPQSFTTWWPLPFKRGSLEKWTQRFSPSKASDLAVNMIHIVASSIYIYNSKPLHLFVFSLDCFFSETLVARNEELFILSLFTRPNYTSWQTNMTNRYRE